MERASDGFHIDLDDFLSGLLLLANELVSFILDHIYKRILDCDWFSAFIYIM